MLYSVLWVFLICSITSGHFFMSNELPSFVFFSDIFGLVIFGGWLSILGVDSLAITAWETCGLAAALPVLLLLLLIAVSISTTSSQRCGSALAGTFMSFC